LEAVRNRYIIALLAVLLVGCAAGTPTAGDPATQAPPLAQDQASPPVAPEPEPEPEPEPQPEYARILAVGDLLMHTPLVYSSQVGDDFDFKPLFEPVRPWVEGADLAYANLETTLTGPDYPWAGYPSFNTPPQFARDIKAVGWDVITNANNHALDYDEFGLTKTADHLDQYGMPHTGTNRTPEEREQILVLNVTPTIKIAMLAYTAFTNGIPLPQPYSVNMVDPERMPADIRRARQLPGVDLVAVALHFGDEYAREPNQEQRRYVQLALEAGADIILGDHVHVIQPIEVRQVKDEFGRDQRRAVIFSLGNFISNQSGIHREAGLMMLVDIKKEKGVTTVEEVSFIPTWTHPYYVDGVRHYRVVAVEKALRDYEAKLDPLLTKADYNRLKEVWADTAVQAAGSPEVTVFKVDRPPALAGR
jgi:poly-gamma-glutamate capsule biosynthesis protein CapA/YwtB (metallophosphatase superfamily)